MLVVGAPASALRLARRLRNLTDVVAVLDEPFAADAVPRGTRAVRGRISALTGHLGRFEATLDEPVGERAAPARTAVAIPDHFDLVIDMLPTPLIDLQLPPLGYLRVARGTDPSAVFEALPRLRGEIKKPRYVSFEPKLCVHARRSTRGCERCLATCPAGALSSDQDVVALDPYRCRGCGACSAACPTGALSFESPPAPAVRAGLQAALEAYAAAGGTDPCIAFCPARPDVDALAMLQRSCGERLVPLTVEAPAAIGLDVVLQALLGGAAEVVTVLGTGTPPATREAAGRQLALAHALLAGIGHEPGRVLLYPGADPPPEPQTGAAASASAQRPEGATGSAREALLDAVAGLGAERGDPIPLPPGAPFGGIEVDSDRCTLCAACVTLCPTRALSSSQDGGVLEFAEQRCVQCGLCERGCPERAIELVPRLLPDPAARRSRRALHRARLAACVECARPFLPQVLLERSLALLGGAEAADEGQRRLLQTCPTCRANATLEAQTVRRPKR